jgi:hypothetical protein
VPGQQGVRRYNRGHILYDAAPEGPGFRGEPTALIVREAQTPGPKLFPQHAIFLLQIGDDIALLLVHPTGEATRTNCSGCDSEGMASRLPEAGFMKSLGPRDPTNLVFYQAALESWRRSNCWTIRGGDPAGYTFDEFPDWIKQQRTGGATIHADQPPHFRNDGEPLGESLSCGAAETFVLTVNTGQPANARFLMLLIEYGEFTAILAGDAEGVTETQAITNFANDLKANVLGAAHHGSNSNQSNGATWINAVAPDVVVFSAGQLFGHPRCTALSRFNAVRHAFEHDVRCGVSNEKFEPPFRTRKAQYVTDMNGAIVVTSNGQSPLRVNCTGSAAWEATIPH